MVGIAPLNINPLAWEAATRPVPQVQFNPSNSSNYQDQELILHLLVALMQNQQNGSAPFNLNSSGNPNQGFEVINNGNGRYSIQPRGFANNTPYSGDYQSFNSTFNNTNMQPYTGSMKGVDELKASLAGVADGKILSAFNNLSPAVQAQYIESGNDNGVDPLLLVLQGYQESGLKTTRNGDVIESPAGAQGISQFIPGTASKYGVNVHDPISSIKGQARYMAAINKKLGGWGHADRYDLMLAGYNAGENRRSSLGEGRVPNIEETQGYVKNIMGWYNQARGENRLISDG